MLRRGHTEGVARHMPLPEARHVGASRVLEMIALHHIEGRAILRGRREVTGEVTEPTFGTRGRRRGAGLGQRITPTSTIVRTDVRRQQSLS